MIEWLDNHLVPEWRKAWKWSSVRLAALVSTAVAAFASQPQLLLSIVNYMPADPTQRALAAIVVGAVAFFGPTVLRLWKQGANNDAARTE
jgi:H+/Cl- antiporter ClcA